MTVTNYRTGSYERHSGIVILISFIIWWLTIIINNIYRQYLASNDPLVVNNAGVSHNVGVAPVAGASTSNNVTNMHQRNNGMNFWGRTRGFFGNRTVSECVDLARIVFVSLFTSLIFQMIYIGRVTRASYIIMIVAFVIGELWVLSRFFVSNRLVDVPILVLLFGLFLSIWSLSF